MTHILSEISALEECLRQAELGPDPKFFQNALADTAVIVGQDGRPSLAKSMIVDAHKPGRGPKFTKVEMKDLVITEHGANVAVVTCTGTYEAQKFSITLKFMRVWVKKGDRWQIVAGSVSN
ncbi:MAG: nuclear transport factor 2 family protein [Proteobacteria bacterium]|nr:nuclear transport factor 2 family protein [Pseudomonadota bacterium]